MPRKIKPKTPKALKPTAITSKTVEALVKQATPKAEATRRRATELIELVNRKLEFIAEAFYDIGLALLELSQPPLYSAIGYGSFEDLLHKKKLMGRSAAYELIRIAENLTRQDALRLGKEKAHAIIQYVSATKQKDSAHQLVVDGKIEGKAIDLLAAKDLESMARRQRRSQKDASLVASAGQKTANHAARTLQAWLRRRGAKQAVAAAVFSDGVWWAEVRVKPDEIPKIIQ